MTRDRGDWIQTFTGGVFYPASPHPDDVDIRDIAHGLSMQCRYNGQCFEFYSIAEHSVRVAHLVPDELRLLALLHDAAEAYIGDMVRPLKMMLPEFRNIEALVEQAIGQRFGVHLLDLPTAVKYADLQMLALERRDLMPAPPLPWRALENVEVPRLPRIEPMSPNRAKARFLEMFEVLTR